MSILLDALRKSEQRKRRGDVPSIHSPGPEEPADNGGRRWRTPLLLIAALLIIAWLSWRQYAPPPDGEWNVVGKPQPASTESPPTPSRVDAPPPGSAGEPGRARSPVERLADAEPPVVEPGEQQPPPTEADAQPMDEALASMPEAGGESGEEPTDQLADASPGESANEEWAPGDPEPISYWQLPESTRSQLPPLKITVLVYADFPQDRFILVDGTRMVEGDRHGELELQEIRRDGAVFRHGMYRFLVKQ